MKNQILAFSVFVTLFAFTLTGAQAQPVHGSSSHGSAPSHSFAQAPSHAPGQGFNHNGSFHNNGHSNWASNGGNHYYHNGGGYWNNGQWYGYGYPVVGVAVPGITLNFGF